MVHRGTNIIPLSLLLLLSSLLVASFVNVGQAGDERNAGRKLAGENPLTAKETLTSYWKNHISNGLPRPQFFMDKVSPLNALDLATFSKLAEQGSLSTQLHDFCSKANLICGSELSTKLLFDYIAAENEIKTDRQMSGKYFREIMLKPGTLMPMFDIGDKMPKRSFLPRVISSELPLTSNLFGEFKKIFQRGSKDSNPVSDKKSGYHGGYGDSSYQGSYEEKPSYSGGYDEKKSYHGGYGDSSYQGSYEEKPSYSGGYDEKKSYHGGYGDSSYQGSYEEKPSYSGGYDEKKSYHGGYGDSSYQGSYEEKPSYSGGYNEKKAYHGGYRDSSYQGSYEEKPSYSGGYDEKKSYHGGYGDSSYQGSYEEKPSYSGGYDEKKAYHGSYDEKSAYHGGYDQKAIYHGGYDKKGYEGGYDEKKVYHGGYDKKLSVYQAGYEVSEKVALHECAVAPNRGEIKKCVGSGEDMIDFATSVLGRNLELRTTENTRGINNDVLIGSVKGINAGKTTKLVLCHQTLHPYLVYYCHAVPKVRVYEADILDQTTKVKINRGVAICHIDTSSWGSGQEAFRVLGSGPGKIEVCHWIFENDLAWATAD